MLQKKFQKLIDRFMVALYSIQTHDSLSYNHLNGFWEGDFVVVTTGKA